MAMMRLLARDSGHFAVLPPVVVRDELRNGDLFDYGALPGVYEEFYAIVSGASLKARPCGSYFHSR